MEPFMSTMTSPTPEWLKELLENQRVTDICINDTRNREAGGIFIDQGNGMETFQPASDCPWSEDQKREWLVDQLSQIGRSWDARFPFIDATISSGHRLHAALPPLAPRGILLSIRRLAAHRGLSSLEYETNSGSSRWKGSPGFELLREAIIRGDSILLCGATGSGKTTLASDLLSEVHHSERIIALEDTPELCPRHPHFVSLVSRPPNADGYGEITLRMLLKQVLRMRPDRIVLGECRGGEVLELLQALNTGHRGALATLHANSPRDALKRIELLCLLSAAGSIPLQALRELMSSGVQWVGQVERQAGIRKISEVWRIEGREGDTILMRPMVKS
jgi:pilus assembly protein CpaF